MLTPQFLEGMNGTLFMLLIFACFMFGLYIVREMVVNGYQRTRLQAAISIFVTLSGEALIRGWVWWWRHIENTGGDAAWMGKHPVLLYGALIEIVGIMCVIRVFAPDSWGRNIWLVSTLVASGAATVFLYL